MRNQAQPQPQESQLPLHFAQQALLDLSPSQQAPPTPSFLRASYNGQKFVKDDCSRLKPTNAVNQSQYGLW